MSEYLLLLLFLLFGVTVEVYLKRTPKWLYIFTMLIMGLMFVFRYGQGTDYFGYKWIFSVISPNASFSELRSLNINSEIGWRLLCQGAKKIGMSYETMVIFVSLIEWIGFSRFIRRLCPRRMLALLMSYHTLYLTYMFSALRQGVIICIFLGFLLPCYLEKKYKKYVAGCLVCSFVHSVALVGLLPLVLLRLELFKNTKRMVLSVSACFAIGLLLSTGLFNDFLRIILPTKVLYYFRRITLSFAILERIVMFGIMICLYMSYCKRVFREGKSISDATMTLIKIYVLSAMLYGILIWMPMVASRVSYLFKSIEIILLCVFYEKEINLKKLIPVFVAVYSVFMCFKNIDAYISQGRYYNSVNVINYPYFSILEKEDVMQYRDIIYTFEE